MSERSPAFRANRRVRSAGHEYRTFAAAVNEVPIDRHQTVVYDLKAIRTYTNTLESKRLPLPLRAVTHYANAEPTERSWRRVVLGPLRQVVLGGVPIREGPIFGITSRQEAAAVLDRFRELLTDLCEARDKRNWLRLQDLIDEIHRRSNLKLIGQLYDSGSRRLVPRWETDQQSFEEMLYAYLVLSFYSVRIDALRRCVACQRLFFTVGQKARYCTGRCQIRLAMKRYRDRKRMISRPTDA